MIDLLSLIPLQQTSPAVSTDLSAPAELDFSALLNELVAPAEHSTEVTAANTSTLLNREDSVPVEVAGPKTSAKEDAPRPATNLLAPLPSAGPFFQSQIPSSNSAHVPEPTTAPEVLSVEGVKRSILDDLKKFELTVHYELPESVQPAPKQTIVTSDPIASIREPQVLARFVELQQQPRKATPPTTAPATAPQLIQSARVDVLKEFSRSANKSAGPERVDLTETAPAVNEYKREVVPLPALLPTSDAPLAHPVPAPRISAEVTSLQPVQPIQVHRTHSVIARVQVEQPVLPRPIVISNPIVTMNPLAMTNPLPTMNPVASSTPVVRLAPTRTSSVVIPILQAAADPATQSKVPVAVSKTISQLPELASPSQDLPQTTVKEIKRVEIKSHTATAMLNAAEPAVAEVPEDAVVGADNIDDKPIQLPLSRAVVTPKAFVDLKQENADKPESDPSHSSNSNSAVPVVHVEYRSGSSDAVEQPQQTHPVEIPHIPKLQVVRTVSMEVGDPGSEVAVRIQERNGGMTLHFGTGSDALQHTIESSVGALVHALKQEQIQLSNVEVTRKSPIEKIRRMKEAH